MYKLKLTRAGVTKEGTKWSTLCKEPFWYQPMSFPFRALGIRKESSREVLSIAPVVGGGLPEVAVTTPRWGSEWLVPCGGTHVSLSVSDATA